MTIAVVLVHLGTPRDATAQSVRAFLKPFLSDRRVVEIPRLVWLPILYGFILPFRPKVVSKAYAELWHKWGDSPLRVFAARLERKLSDRLQQLQAQQATPWHGNDIRVITAMTYSDRRIADVIDSCMQDGIEQIIFVPMYPQYSATTTAAVFDQINAHLKTLRVVPDIRVVRHFHRHERYQQALADSVRDYWHANERSQVLLMSFHGIPQANVDKGDPYAAHCEFTAQSLAQRLGLDAAQWRMSYQSRLGRAQWLQPYTIQTVEELARQGVESIDVVCPAFSLDCIETLEEIVLQNREKFLAHGGKELRLIPCLNDRDDHVEMLVDIIQGFMPSYF
jgi:protoporphyrin/coproporphyrin ferrochelatase